ncbi:TetR/AcrR family transcriptional regulator [Nocardia sp. BSTN01]|uniref:TetR/AcrR family transcriptional regulator n=1 Tax=Nocardia sp. BSTN01 TaxID=2783665 RepID=UPI00188F4EDF|nr:TetR/AcrR family transcriptional regulator [Nocardia sp. BSTN01]MBF4997017.1 TetR/AcrR family transcriptional regulator [Nocardia sp. BSTN01]
MAPEQRREQLLDAVLRVIVEQGVHKVSIDTVARAADVSRPVIYGLFDDSEQLLRASLDREEAGALAQIAEVVATVEAGTDPVDALLGGFDAFLAEVQAAPDRWRAIFLIADASTPAFRRRIDRARQSFLGAVENFVRSSTPARQPAGFDAALTARMLYALFWEAGRLVLADPEAFPASRIRDYARSLARILPT